MSNSMTHLIKLIENDKFIDNESKSTNLYKKRRKNQKKTLVFFILDLSKQIFEYLFMIGYDDLCCYEWKID